MAFKKEKETHNFQTGPTAKRYYYAKRNLYQTVKKKKQHLNSVFHKDNGRKMSQNDYKRNEIILFISYKFWLTYQQSKIKIKTKNVHAN